MNHHLFASVRLACLLLFGAIVVSATADEKTPANPTGKEPGQPVKLTAAEQGFARSLGNASLIGGFTVAGADRQADQPPPVRPERYDLGEVRKVGDNLWQIPARVRYGDHDVTLPITLPVEWAGDTAVIVVDNVGFPGLGVYSARVMIHNGRYAGFWSGGGQGGHLFGVIKPGRPTPGTPAAAKP